ncbi:hypothetical protein [Paraburkholderia sediminicola]|uniref:hypothetical protein n=1 Tax=Paraburkholderia sediminicola TaxID=458836 RepID=UPI0038B769EC
MFRKMLRPLLIILFSVGIGQMRSSQPVASTGALPSVFQFDAVVEAGPRYTLSAPADGTVIKAPSYGDVYKSAKPWSIYFPTPDDEENSPVIFKLHRGVVDVLQAKFTHYQAMDGLLQDYGQRGASFPISNRPWDGVDNPVIRAAIEAGTHIHDDTPTLESEKDQLSKEPDGAPLSPLLQEVSKKISEDAHLPRSLSPNEWRNVIRSIVIYEMREARRLNSSDYYVSFNGSDVFDTEPNNAAFDRSNTRVFRVGRPSFNTDPLTQGHGKDAGNFMRYWKYWKTVHDEKLLNSADLNYLSIISYTSYKNSKSPDEILDIILADCAAAYVAISNWEHVYQHITRYAGSVRWKNAENNAAALANLDSDLRTVTPALLDLDINAIKLAADHVRELATPQTTETEWPTIESMSIITDQMRPPIKFKGALIDLIEENSSVDSRLVFYLNTPLIPYFAMGSSIQLPVEPGSALWETLIKYKSQLIGMDLASGNPFTNSIIQAITGLYSTLSSPWPSGRLNIDRAAQIVKLIHTIQSQMMDDLARSAIPFRQYAIDLLRQYFDDTTSLRNGNFQVPEKSQVDAVSVEDGQWVPAGTTLAVFRPVARFGLRVTSVNPLLREYLLKGVSVAVRLSCSGTLPVTAAQRRLILQMPRRKQLVKLLDRVERKYVSTHTFEGVLDEQSLSAANSGARDTKQLLVSVKVGDSQQSVRFSKGELGGTSFASTVADLKAVGFEVSVSNKDAIITLDAGPVEIGSKCNGILVPSKALLETIEEQKRWLDLVSAN